MQRVLTHLILPASRHCLLSFRSAATGRDDGEKLNCTEVTDAEHTLQEAWTLSPAKLSRDVLDM